MDVIAAVVRAVADREGKAVTELPPLYDAVDPDVLRRFVDSETGSGATLRFTYCGHEVVVRDDGSVDVRAGRSRYRYR